MGLFFSISQKGGLILETGLIFFNFEKGWAYFGDWAYLWDWDYFRIFTVLHESNHIMLQEAEDPSDNINKLNQKILQSSNVSKL